MNRLILLGIQCIHYKYYSPDHKMYYTDRDLSSVYFFKIIMYLLLSKSNGYNFKIWLFNFRYQLLLISFKPEGGNPGATKHLSLTSLCTVFINNHSYIFFWWYNFWNKFCLSILRGSKNTAAFLKLSANVSLALQFLSTRWKQQRTFPFDTCLTYAFHFKH